MEWEALESHLTEQEIAAVAPAKDFLQSRLTLQPEWGAQEKQEAIQRYLQHLRSVKPSVDEGFVTLSRALRRMENKKERNGFYEMLSQALIERVDDMRGVIPERTLTNKDDYAAAQIEALSHDAEGCLVLNAVSVLHRPMVQFIARRMMEEWERFSYRRRPVLHRKDRSALEDLIDVGVYGTFRLISHDGNGHNGDANNGDVKKNGTEDLNSDGLLAGFVKYDRCDPHVSKFATYASSAIEAALSHFHARFNKGMIFWPSARHAEGSIYGEMDDFFVSPPKELGEDTPEELKESLEDRLRRLKPRERKIIELRNGMADGNQYTLEEVGRIFKITRERVRQIEAKVMKRLSGASRLRRYFDTLVEREERHEEGSWSDRDVRKHRRHVLEDVPSPVICNYQDRRFILELKPAFYSKDPANEPESRYLMEYLEAIGVKNLGFVDNYAEPQEVSVSLVQRHNGVPGLYAIITCDKAATYQNLKPLIEAYPFPRTTYSKQLGR